MGFFVPPFYGVNIRIDNRVGRNRLIPDKKNEGFLKCNQMMYNEIKNHPDMKDYNFIGRKKGIYTLVVGENEIK